MAFWGLKITPLLWLWDLGFRMGGLYDILSRAREMNAVELPTTLSTELPRPAVLLGGVPIIKMAILAQLT